MQEAQSPGPVSWDFVFCVRCGLGRPKFGLVEFRGYMSEQKRHSRNKPLSSQEEPLIRAVARTIGHAAGKLTRLTQEFVGKPTSEVSTSSPSPGSRSVESKPEVHDQSDRSRRRARSSAKKESGTKKYSKPKTTFPKPKKQRPSASKKTTRNSSRRGGNPPKSSDQQ